MKHFAMTIGLLLLTYSQAQCFMINYDFSLTISTLSSPSPFFDLEQNDSISGSFCFDKDIFPNDAAGGDAAAPYGFTGQVQLNNFDNYLYGFTIAENQQLTSLCFYDDMDFMLRIDFTNNSFSFFGEDFVTPIFNYSGYIDYLHVVNPIIVPQASTPEPSTIILLTAGLSAYAGFKRKKIKVH